MNSQTLTMFVPLILLIAAMYFLLIRPQKKREREVNNMRANLHVGDEIVTIGGICGKIVKTKDESIVIQVGADKVKMEMMKWSVSKVVNPAEARAARKADRAMKEEAEEEAPKKAMPKRMKKAEEVVEETEAKAEEAVEAAEEKAEAAAKAVEAEVDEAASEAFDEE